MIVAIAGIKSESIRLLAAILFFYSLQPGFFLKKTFFYDLETMFFTNLKYLWFVKR